MNKIHSGILLIVLLVIAGPLPALAQSFPGGNGGVNIQRSISSSDETIRAPDGNLIFASASNPDSSFITETLPGGDTTSVQRSLGSTTFTTRNASGALVGEEFTVPGTSATTAGENNQSHGTVMLGNGTAVSRQSAFQNSAGVNNNYGSRNGSVNATGQNYDKPLISRTVYASSSSTANVIRSYPYTGSSGSMGVHSMPQGNWWAGGQHSVPQYQMASMPLRGAVPHGYTHSSGSRSSSAPIRVSTASSTRVTVSSATHAGTTSHISGSSGGYRRR